MLDCQTLARDGLLNLGVGLVAPWRVVKWRRVKWGTLEWSLVLFGVRHENQDFIAIHFVHPSGVIMDPFVRNPVGSEVPFSPRPHLCRCAACHGQLDVVGTTPVHPVVAEWPAQMIPPWELEEE